MKILKKMNDAIESIKSQNLKKKGRNKFSQYDYYTPEQVSELVVGTCHKIKLFPKFDLIRNEMGISGTLSIYDLESDEQPIVFEMASDIPSIKATNIAQQLGGAMTYTKRYLYMNAFDISDNNLDFDTTENTKKSENKAETKIDRELFRVIHECKTQADLTKLWNTKQDLHTSADFISELGKRKKVLINNGIDE